jgi:hypothetical protein
MWIYAKMTVSDWSGVAGHKVSHHMTFIFPLAASRGKPFDLERFLPGLEMFVGKVHRPIIDPIVDYTCTWFHIFQNIWNWSETWWTSDDPDLLFSWESISFAVYYHSSSVVRALLEKPTFKKAGNSKLKIPEILGRVWFDQFPKD